MVGQVGVEGHAVAGVQRVLGAVDVQGQGAALEQVVSRAPGSCRGGSPGPPVTAPGASVWRVTSARRPGSGGVRTS